VLGANSCSSNVNDRTPFKLCFQFDLRLYPKEFLKRKKLNPATDPKVMELFDPLYITMSALPG